jgi:IMP dehydrogenase
MAPLRIAAELDEYLTFDDVLLKPAASSVMPGETDTSTKLTRSISLAIPIMSAAMDTVTEANLAIAMAQAGGLGVIHRNLDPDAQAAEVRRVKKFESGMVVNPITISPEATLADVLALKDRYRISGIPVVRDDGTLAGIITNRDVRFATDLGQKVKDLMTRENLVTVKETVDRDEARRLLHRYRIEKLIVVDDDYRCIGLITVTDMEKAALHPSATKDADGRLRVAAAVGTGDTHFERAERLIEAGCDLIVVDTAHGHSKHVIDQVARIKRLSNRAEVIAGNIATPDAVKALADAGADAVKVGIGPGSICTTGWWRGWACRS